MIVGVNPCLDNYSQALFLTQVFDPLLKFSPALGFFEKSNCLIKG
jgi:hypothetical protein